MTYTEPGKGRAMNEAQMRSLVRAIELGSINVAARDLFVTPPSLHQRIVALEGELGCTLLERDRRGVRPTEEGKRLYAACVACLEHLAAARDGIAAVRRAGSPRRVCIGVAWRPSLRAYYAIESLHELTPELTVSVVKVTDKSLVDALVAGDIDIFESPRLADEPHGLEFWRFEEESYRCVCGPESRWAHRGLVTPDMLDGVAVYAGSDYRAYRSYLDKPSVQRLCAQENFKAEPFPTERIVADCMGGAAVVLFTASRADDLCPPLVHAAFDIPPVETGAYVRAQPSDDVLAVVGALRQQACSTANPRR